MRQVCRAALVAALACLFSCAREAPDRHDLETPDDGVRARYAETSERVEAHTDEFGYAVVFDGDTGEAKHQGDALWRTGLALAALPCDRGQGMLDALESMVAELEGGFWRHPSKPDQISMDQAMTVYLAAASRASRCPDEVDYWAGIMSRHRDFMDASGDRLNPKSSVKLPAEFDFVRDQVLHKLGLAGQPHENRRSLFETQVGAWAHATRQAKAACYRVFLGYVSLRTVEWAGRSISDNGRNLYCAATGGMGLPVVDHFCGRPGLSEWIAAWQANIWDVQHQRCVWESPDCPGDSCAGIDLLHGLVEQYDLL